MAQTKFQSSKSLQPEYQQLYYPPYISKAHKRRKLLQLILKKDFDLNSTCAINFFVNNRKRIFYRSFEMLKQTFYRNLLELTFS